MIFTGSRRPFDRRAQGRAAGGRLCREGSLSRFRRLRAGAFHQSRLLSGRWRCRGDRRARRSRSSMPKAGPPTARSRSPPPRAALVDKGGHSHFMAKEIHEQPEVVGHTLAHYLDPAGPNVRRARQGPAPMRWPRRRALTISACGTAYYAGHGRQILVREAGAPGGGNRCGVRVALSRSGLSEGRRGAVHLAVGRDRRHAGGAARCQGQGPDHHRASSMCRKAPSRARPISCCRPMPGPEIGVASTKAFTCQLAALAALPSRLARARGTISSGRRKAPVRRIAGSAAPYRRNAEAGAALQGARPGNRQGARRALSGPRPKLPAGAGRRA